MSSKAGALTPLALQNAELLRALRDSTYATAADLAADLGRDRSNLVRSLKSLRDAELIGPDDGSVGKLTPAGEDAVAALDRADNVPDMATAEELAAQAMPAGFALLSLREIIPDPLNPRKHFDKEAIAELAESIARDQLLENLVVRPHPLGTVLLGLDGAGRETRTPLFTIVAGERRWRAMQLLADQDRWDDFAPSIPCKIVEIDDAAHRRIALVENLQRKDLRPIDEAQALKDLMEVTGQGTAEIAKEIGFTQRFVQQRLQLLGLPDTVQDQVNAGEVTIEKARAIAAILPDLPADKAKALTTGKMTPEQAKTWLENQPKLREEITPRQWLILLEIADASARAHGDFDSNVPVGPDIADDPDWAALKAIGYWFVNGPHTDFDAGFAVGRRISFDGYGESGLTQLRLKYGDALDDEAARGRILAQARADAGVEFALAMEPGEYTIPWLRGPFEVPAEVQAQIAQAKADRAAAVQRQAEADKEAARRQGEAFNVAQSVLVQHRKRDLPQLDARYAEAFHALDIELPVTVAPNGDVIDARGRTLVRSGWAQSTPTPILGRNTLLALAINAAAGIHTPDHPKPAEAPDVLPRAEFIEIIAGCLVDDIDDLDETEANLMAERGLAAYLATEAIDYGDPAHDWEEAGAMAIAQGIREDGLGQAQGEPADEDADAALETEDT